MRLVGGKVVGVELDGGVMWWGWWYVGELGGKWSRI